MRAKDDVNTESAFKRQIIFPINKNPICKPFPDIWLFVGVSVVFDFSTLCEDPDGHDMHLKSNLTVATWGAKFDDQTNELSGKVTSVINSGGVEVIQFNVTDGYMAGSSADFFINVRTRNVLTSVAPSVECNAVGAGVYKIKNISSSTIFAGATGGTTITFEYLGLGNPLTITNDGSIHKKISGNLSPGKHQY